MKNAPALLSSISERLLALLFLICLLPALLLIGFLLRSNSDERVLLSAPSQADGATVQGCRFRTTGRGNRTFRGLGGFLRAYSIDEIPGLWSVVRGHIRFKQLLQKRRIS